jgi:hypothetical protein
MVAHPGQLDAIGQAAFGRQINALGGFAWDLAVVDRPRAAWTACYAVAKRVLLCIKQSRTRKPAQSACQTKTGQTEV